ncbi:hypothetical protein A3Q29_16990 [Providencia stuartii]|uniref:Uncharacterized protein n=1 Tax=Providencia stuartii TaxID=588 RepID=A0A1S1HQF3_PROST|nr:hypothetical protein A3Q29_16990 [Providencia stuartii]
MIPYAIYFVLTIFGIIVYFKVKNQYSSIFRPTSTLIYIRRFLIVYCYIVGAYSIYLTTKQSEDTIANWMMFGYSVIILLCYLKMIWKLESFSSKR